MYLRRLEIAGFKSFADRVKIELEPGVSAIVGPNGSGKSNIAEAIRWVLGERAGRTLRAAKTEELIFSGTEKGRAKASMAEVSMVLSGDARDTELATEELRISRKIYRSGESEYRINGRKVLARDLAKILAQAGFGTSSYTVIGQGMVEGLIIASPAERKLLFEEASGIRGFELERAEVLVRLRQARDQADTLRGESAQLIPERDKIGRQVDRLARRREVAGDLKVAQQTFLQQELTRVRDAQKATKQQTASLEKHIAQLAKQEKDLQAKADSLASASKTNTAEHAAVLSALADLDQKRTGITELIARAEVELELKQADVAAKAKLVQPGKSRDQATKRLASLQEQLQEQTKKSEGLNEKVAAFDEKIRGLTKQLTALRQALRANQRAGYLGQALGLAQMISRQLTDDKELSKDQLRIVLHKLVRTVKLAHDSDLADAPERIARLQQQIAREMTKREEITEKQTTIIIRIRSLELDIHAQERELEELKAPTHEKELKALKKEVAVREKELQKMHTKRDAYEAEQERLRAELNGISRQDTTQKQVEIAHALEEAHQLVRVRQDELERCRLQDGELSRDETSLLAQAKHWGVKVAPASKSEHQVSRDDITRLEAELALIGEIDETLVATHAELDGRVKYLEGQAQDMERAIGDLEKVLEELARRIKSTFEENFARINKAFGKNFASLFAGGSAELTLLQLDEENYGIEISVQPPGKRVTALSTLSGGEKALSAIALLAAILEVNPSPFVLLDEVDAALDDRNAQLFQQTLTRLAKKSQILVITHNHETMVHADRLYGVTASPRTASTVLSVKLSEVELAS